MKRFGIIAMFLVLLTACQEEMDFNKVQEGVPAKLGLTVSLTSSEKIQTRGIKDYESEISELLLIMYEANGRKMVIDLTGNLVAGAADGAYGGHRTYTTAEQIEQDINGDPVLSGTYRVYAIANWSSPFCELGKDELIAMSEEELNSAVGTNTGFVYNLTGSQRFPMTGYTEGIEIKPFETEGETQVTDIMLRRMTSHIEFKFINGTNKDGKAVSFVPQSYTVYNIPSGAYLMDNRSGVGSDASGNKYNGSYSHSKSIEIVSGGEIAFFMQENVQGPADNVSAYADREKWDGTRNDGTKRFINAPENATYVTVTGEYEDNKYTGTVSYTIHLGKFGKASDASRAYDNFEVCRNEYHTYTITVNGVNSIVTEATQEEENGGNNPGAEGTITQTNKGSQFVLDAHYETVMLGFHLSPLCANANLIIETPYQGIKEFDLIDDSNNPIDISSIDASWVHFMAPTDTTQLPKYDKDSCIDIAELAAELKAAWNNDPVDKKHYLTSTTASGSTRIHVVAFVDEYFYEKEPGTETAAEWTDFVNKENRTMILNPDRSESQDNNSIIYPDYIFQISQRSIKTTYGMASSNVNALGIETWNETGRVEWGSPASEDNLDDYDGYDNTSALLGNSWLGDDVIAKAGYVRSVAGNAKEDHVFYDTGLGLSGIYGYNSCLTRNRDEDGDGRIDEGELKWYLPAVFQYTALWMGLDYLKEDTQLFDPRTSITESSQLVEYNFFTSSSNSDSKSIYWAIEGASWGRRNNDDTPYNNIRCVRNLYDTDNNGVYEDENPRVTFNEESSRTITVTGASESALRNTDMTGEYAAGHNERSQDNRLPKAFEVGENLLGESSSGTITENFKISLASVSYSGYDITLSFAKEGYTYEANIGGYLTIFDGTESNTLTVSRNTAYSGDNTWATVTITNKTTYASGKVVLWFDYSEGIPCQGYKFYEYDQSTANEYPVWGFTTDEITSVELTRGSEKMYVSYSAIRDNTEGFCASLYCQNDDASDLGQWRVPNQRELMLMAEYGYLDTSLGEYASRTFYTYSELGKIYPFSYIGHLTLDPGTSSFVIRCVRDTEPSSEAELIDGYYSDSGNSLF